MSRKSIALSVASLLLFARGAGAATAPSTTAELPSGRLLTPVGVLAGTPNFPTQAVAQGNHVTVLNGGANKLQSLRLYAGDDLHVLAVADTLLGPTRPTSASGAVAPAVAAPGANVAQGTAGELPAAISAAIPDQSLFQGLSAGPDGMLYATGGASDDLLAFTTRGGRLTLQRRYALRWQAFPRRQYPYQYAGNWQQARLFYPDSVVTGPAGKHAYVTGLLANSLARVDLASGATRYLNVGSYPFAVVLADGGKRLVVSDWGGNGVTVVDRAAWKVLGEVPTGPVLGARSFAAGAHPTALAAQPGTPLVWVADANLDRIVAVDTQTLKVMRVLDDAPYPDAPPGAYPDALAIAHGRLFVANAGNDDVAVFDLASGTRTALIPTGWYPTALSVHGDALYVVSAKGMGSGPNLGHQWVGDFMHGLLQRVDLRELPAHASLWTAQALHDDGFSTTQRSALAATNAQAQDWLHAHIRHVVFILRENKTFDENFGDYAAAGHWADPALDLYGPRQLPNLYAMAARSALFVNFYADGEVTSQGHQWTTAGSDSDFLQRTWSLYYSARGYIPNSGWTQDLVPAEPAARNPYAIYTNLGALGHWSNPWITYPARLFLFNDLLAHHVGFEDFGEFAARDKIGDISPALRAHLAMNYPAWDRLILDTQRARVFDDWVRAHAKALPRVIYIWLPDDHTAGRAACMASPDSYVADNDHATAEVIHTLSMLPGWKHTLVLITEDDAQSGADHIDAHRTFAVALGPWVKPGAQVAEHLSQVDLLRTIEAVAGVPPMSQWDAGAHVLDGIWRTAPDTAPVPVLPMQVAMRRNAGTCPADSPFRHWPIEHVPGADHIAWNDLPGARSYTPTALLKISGPEQMRQEWLASKGPAAYAALLTRLRAMAAQQKRPLQSLIAGDAGD